MKLMNKKIKFFLSLIFTRLVWQVFGIIKRNIFVYIENDMS